jgi:hypothetical protein
VQFIIDEAENLEAGKIEFKSPVSSTAYDLSKTDTIKMGDSDKIIDEVLKSNKALLDSISENPSNFGEGKYQ